MSNQPKLKIAWYGKHFGEEPPLVGKAHQGSGTIFFSSCNLKCVFCQNYQISQEKTGEYYSIADLVRIMLGLQDRGAVNINLVTPTIWWRAVRQALIQAKHKGLKIPVVWNSNAYEAVEIIEGLAGLVDIYLPDFKYADDQLAWKYSRGKNYSVVARQAIKLMLAQTGHLKLDAHGLAERGVLARHLILPGHVANSLRVLKILTELDADINLSLMSQYQPVYQANRYSEINRPITAEEFEQVFARLSDLGLQAGWVQDLDSCQMWMPDFQHTRPFMAGPCQGNLEMTFYGRALDENVQIGYIARILINN